MGTEAPEAPAAPQPAPPAPAPVPSPPTAPPADLTDWKAEAERWKAQARQNEQRSKANHAEVTQRDDVLRQIAEKVGVPFDGKPDPAALTAQLERQTQLARDRSVQLAVFSSASGTPADATALLDSREFMTKAAALDTDAADFPARVAELVTEAAKQARYQAHQPAPAAQPQAPPAAASGADFSGAPGAGGMWTEADYQQWVANGQDQVTIDKAINEGRLVALGVGKPKRGRGRN